MNAHVVRIGGTEMSLRSITPNLMVEDVEATVEWYQRVFDADVVATLPTESQPDHWWAQVSIDGTDLMFQARDSLSEKLPNLRDEQIGGSFALYADVSKSQELFSDLEEAGVEIIQSPYRTDFGWKQFAVEDCNGYILWFGEMIEEQGAEIGRGHRTYPDYLTDETESPAGVRKTSKRVPESWG